METRELDIPDVEAGMPERRRPSLFGHDRSTSLNVTSLAWHVLCRDTEWGMHGTRRPTSPISKEIRAPRHPEIGVQTMAEGQTGMESGRAAQSAGTGLAAGGQAGMVAGGAMAGAASGITGWGVGVTWGMFMGLVAGIFLGLAIDRSASRPLR